MCVLLRGWSLHVLSVVCGSGQLQSVGDALIVENVEPADIVARRKAWKGWEWDAMLCVFVGILVCVVDLLYLCESLRAMDPVVVCFVMVCCVLPVSVDLVVCEL